MTTPKVVGCCSVLPVQVVGYCSVLPVPNSRSHRHQRNPLGINFFHASTEARCHEFFSRASNNFSPPLYWTCVRTRRIFSRRAYAEKKLVAQNANLRVEREARVRKQLQEPEFSPSSYDTAWVAMVPLPGSLQAPCFPQCVQWILRNQQDNGSWGINQFDSSANKDILLSTLACVLALKKWNVGPEHIRRGIHFIGRNFSTVMDEQIAAPIGFNITFPYMLRLAIGTGLQFPVRQTDVNRIIHLREMELKRFAGDKSYGREAYMAYVAEGLGNLLDLDDVMKFQRKNGSLFNSPSTTAAVLVHNYDHKALQYLNLLVSKFGSAVPTVYPLNIHCQLSMVDTLEKIGISRHFSSDIKGILDMTYSFWLQRDEEVMLDVETCAMAFRLLRMNGYDVSSDELSHFAEASTFHNSVQGYLNDTKSILELYKASKVCLSENELILENIHDWSGSLLKEMFSDGMQSIPIGGEVEYTLKFPFYATVEPLDHKRNIEHFDARDFQKLKTKNLPCRVNHDLLALAVEDFSFCQCIYQDELQDLDSWEKDNRLDQLQFARQRLTYCYLSAAATISHHELSDARVACAKIIELTVVVDDFFDVGGSKDELENLVALVEKWDEPHKDEFYSEQVKIIFSALYTTVNQVGAMASAVQNRDVTKYLVEKWLHLLRSQVTEGEWQRSQYAPTVKEYMTNAVVSFALGPIILTAQLLSRQKLPEYVIKDQEYNELFRVMSTCCRFLNDNISFEREGREGKLNIVSLLVLHSGGSMSIEAAREAIQKSLATSRKDLLRLILREDSVVPRPCKEFFWKFFKTAHLFYSQTDEFTSPKQIVNIVNAVINEPLKFPR